MIIFNYSNNCLPANKTEESPQEPYRPLIICISILATILNGVSVIVLSRSNASHRFGPIRLNLLILSISETALNSCIAMFKILSEPDIDKHFNMAGLLFDTIVFWNILTLICTRNWIVVLIALSRCEVVFLPLNSVRGLKFNNSVIKICSITIVIFSYALSFVRLFSKKATVCSNVSRIILEPYLYHHWQYVIYETYCFFIYQSVLPVILVAGVSLAMFVSLIKGPDDGLKKCMSSRNQIGMRRKNIKAFSQRKATRTIFVLALVFTSLEGPVFIIQALTQSGMILVGKANETLRRHVFSLINLLVVFDSCCNVFVYMITSDKFRGEIRRLMGLFGYCPNGQQSFALGKLSATEHLIVNQTPHMTKFLRNIQMEHIRR